MFDKYQKMNMTELVTELERQQPLVQDFTRDSRTLAVRSGGNPIQMIIPDGRNSPGGIFDINEWGHTQLAQKLKIPKVYYDKMSVAAENELLAENVNKWLENSDDVRFIRVMDSQVRAVVSERYKPIDNINIARCTMEKLVEDFKGLGPKFVDLRLGDTRLYMKAVMEEIQGETRPGDYHSFGFIVTNSEVGAASLRVEPYLQRTSCSNSMIKKSLLRKIHSGPANNPELLISAETRLLQDAALYSEFQDAIATCIDRDIFDKWLDDLQATTEVPIAEPTDALQNITTKYKITEKNAKLIEDFFFKEEDCTQYGLIQGITRAAQELPDYDEAIRWETIAGDLSEMNEKQFVKVVA